MTNFEGREGTSWLPHDDDRLRELAATHSADQIADMMGRTRGGIKKHAHLLQISLKRKDRSQMAPWNGWLPEQDDQLRQLAAKGVTVRAAAVRLKRSYRGIYERAQKLQIKMATDPDLRKAKTLVWEGAIERAKEWWSRGWSGERIAKQLGGSFTRAAVIAKMHRVGLKRDKRERQPRAQRVIMPPSMRPRLRGLPPKSKKAFVMRPIRNHFVGLPSPEPRRTMQRQIANDVARVAHDDLKPSHCRWIVGDPKTIPNNEPLYCGHARERGLAYCSVHSNLAFNVVSEAPRQCFPGDEIAA